MGDDIEALRLRTSDGIELEAELRQPPSGTDAVADVVLAHPHPQHGGSMRSLVTSELFRTLPARGITALRFNFRGVEGSTGTYGEGRAEGADVRAAVDALATIAPPGTSRVERPLVLCGWSFGADVSLTVTDERLAGWFLIASPLRILPVEDFVAAHDPRPKVFAIPEHDQFRPPDGVHEITHGWTNVTIHTIPGADHFLVGRTAMVAELLVEFVSSLG